MNLNIYLITDDRYFKGRDLLQTLEKAMEGGITALQYRFKGKGTKEMYEELLQIRELTKRYGVELVVNDRVDLALAVEADGVHVGKGDLPPTAVRKVVGDKLYVGYTVNSLEELKAAQDLPIDYLGFGAIYPTTTKEDYELVGVEALREAVRISQKPVVCIGGIMPYRVEEVIKAGCRNLAISAGILGFEDVKKATEEIKRAYSKALKQLLLLGKTQ